MCDVALEAAVPSHPVTENYDLPTTNSQASVVARLRRHSGEAMFVAGFLFDFLTMQRIDAWRDLGVQFGYLAAVTTLLVLQQRAAAGVWTPRPRLARWWRFNVDALHFLYGGLLSAYAVLYFRSTTFAAPAVFLSLIVLVMVLNEVPRVRGMGHELRMGLYAFCVLSYLTYFIPIVVGRIGGLIFLLSLLCSALVVWQVTRWLVPREPDRQAARRRLFAPAGIVLVTVALLYVLRLIPPVPLSVQFQGVYHDVVHASGAHAGGSS
jgi:hypothetical protein